MIPELVHVPWGDHHPYDPVPWARAPRQPVTDEPFRVGARATVDVDGVVVEWQAGTARGVTPLERSEDLTWSGTLGPWSQPGRYRFLVPSDPGVSTSWFEVAPVDWTDVAFTAVRVQDGRFVVVAPDGRLMLTPDGESSLAWILDDGDGEVAGDADAELSGWTVTVAGGEVSLSGPIDRVVTVRRGVANGETASWRLGWHLDDSEVLLGTGERFDALDQRGRRPDVRVYEQYKQQGSRTYFPLPWVLSTAGYGLAVDGAARVHFDLGAVDPSHASLTVPTPEAAGRFYAGSPREALRRYLDDVGRPGPLPVWAYGPWMSGNEWDRDTVVRGVVERSDAEGTPATVLVIEAWSDETTFYLFNDTDYAPVPGAEPIPAGGMRHGGRWPDPRGLVEWLHERDLRVLLWQIPVLKDVTEHPQHEADIAHVDAAGLAVTTDDGRPYRNRGWWFPNSRIIDFTNPAARDWWFMKRRYLIDDIGVDGFKTDGGEHLWGDDVVTADGTAGDAAANSYPTRYLEAGYHEFMRSAEVDRPVTFSRAGFAGSQAYPAHWAGDEDSTWEAFRASLVAGLSAAMCGVAFWSWDLAGFSGPLPSAELYKRAAAMAAFSPIMQYHSEHNDHRRPLADRTPWNVADHTGDRAGRRRVPLLRPPADEPRAPPRDPRRTRHRHWRSHHPPPRLPPSPRSCGRPHRRPVPARRRPDGGAGDDGGSRPAARLPAGPGMAQPVDRGLGRRGLGYRARRRRHDPGVSPKRGSGAALAAQRHARARRARRPAGRRRRFGSCSSSIPAPVGTHSSIRSPFVPGTSPSTRRVRPSGSRPRPKPRRSTCGCSGPPAAHPSRRVEASPPSRSVMSAEGPHSLVEGSLDLIAGHQAATGAYLAAAGFENYRYCWLRDGAFIAAAMSDWQRHESASRFHHWAAATIERHAAKVDLLEAELDRARSGTGNPLEPLHDRYVLHTRLHPRRRGRRGRVGELPTRRIRVLAQRRRPTRRSRRCRPGAVPWRRRHCLPVPAQHLGPAVLRRLGGVPHPPSHDDAGRRRSRVAAGRTPRR